MPVCHSVEGRTSRVAFRYFRRSCFCRHLLFLLCRFVKCSCSERPCGSLPAFAWGDILLRVNPYPPHYSMTFAFSAFLFPHLCRLSLLIAFTFVRYSVLPCPSTVTECVRLALFAGR